MRRLVLVPTFHFPERAAANQKRLLGFGGYRYRNLPHNDSISQNPLFQEYWQVVQQTLGTFDLEGKRARLFVEGHHSSPVRIRPGEKVISLGKKALGDRIINDFLVRVGGVIETTESKQLLEESKTDYKRADKAIQAYRRVKTDPKSYTQDYLEKLNSELEEVIRDTEGRVPQRDDFIARRITETLGSSEDEVGFLFLGAGHDVGSRLPADIQTEILDERLVEIGRELKETRENERRKEGTEFPSAGGGEIKD